MAEATENNEIYFDDGFMENLMANDSIGKFIEQGEAFRTLMAYYNCAIMEIETKFNVLNEDFSVEYDRNPIETVKTRRKASSRSYSERDCPSRRTPSSRTSMTSPACV